MMTERWIGMSGYLNRADMAADRPTHEIRMKAGPLCNGAERGHGTVWHAITGQFYDNAPAVCGTSPSIMWSSWQPDNLKVTCPRCLKKLASLNADP